MATAILSNDPPATSSAVHVRSRAGNTLTFVSSPLAVASVMSRATPSVRDNTTTIGTGRIEVMAQRERGFDRVFVAICAHVGARDRGRSRVGLDRVESVQISDRRTKIQ